MGNRYLQVMPVAAPAPVAPVAQVAPVAPVGFMYQNLDFFNPMDGRHYQTALNLNNLDFVNQMDGITYPTALQNQWTWSGLKKEVKELASDSKAIAKAKIHEMTAEKAPEAVLVNLDFVNPIDNRIYHTAL